MVGVYLAGVLLEDLLITQALRQEADYFWERYAEQPDFPVPDTLNLTGYMTGNPAGYQPEPELLALEPGFHALPESADFATVYVTETNGQRLYLVFDCEHVDALAAYF